MSRTQQDQVIDDDEAELCPLCIEEFDISDRNFRPCPCGYQICQFCYNNIKTTMNGLCPACRRQYDDKNIQWKVISPEEMASYKENLAQQAKKKAAARQKEAQRREADSLSRKHLAGIRVRQKNLVYVIGFKPNLPDHQLAEELRKEQYFGQYGKIIKVVVSKSKDTSHQQSVGVYVTFERKEDAARCIQAVDGSYNEGTRLRAQYGTTKYCSAYLRNETCTNRQCMFLHEPGEENESFSRQDLSSMNVISTQTPTQANMPSASQPPLPQPPPQHPPQTIAAASQPMDRQESKDGNASPVDSSDGSALPSTVSWATRNAQSRGESRAPSATNPSPLVSEALPIPQTTIEQPKNDEADRHVSNLSRDRSTTTPTLQATAKASKPYLRTPQSESDLLSSPVDRMRRLFGMKDLKFVFDENSISPEELKIIKCYPLLFDPDGGVRRRLGRSHEPERNQEISLAPAPLKNLLSMELEENAESGSFQLGGEPDENPEMGTHSRQRSAIQPPSQEPMVSPVFTGAQRRSPSALSNPQLNRQSTQPHQLLHSLQNLRSISPNLINQGQPRSASSQYGNMGHGRQTSRFSFANESASASTLVKPATNPKYINQSSAVLPQSHGNLYNALGQQSSNQYFPSGVQGPPPGLKATGTPPVSGGGMFGQGYGFATAGLNYGINTSGQTSNDDMMRDLLKARGSSTGGIKSSDAGRREYMSRSILHQHPHNSTFVSTPGLSSFPSEPQSGAYQDHGLQKQKKKGKKQRHANTSSSGGGVVDLADPSILQARMHQASAAGQALYNAQVHGQDDSNPFSTTLTYQDDLSVGSKVEENASVSVVTARSALGQLEPSLLHGSTTASGREVMSFADSASRLDRYPEPPRIPGLGDLPLPQPAVVAPPEIILEPALQVYPRVATETMPEKQSRPKDKQAAKLSILLEQESAFPPLLKPTPPLISAQSKGKARDSSAVTKTAKKMQTRAPATSGTPRNSTLVVGSSADSESNVGLDKAPKLAKLDTALTQKMDIVDSAGEVSVQDSSNPVTPQKAGRERSATPSTTSRPVTPGSVTETPVKRSTQPRTIRVLAAPKSDAPSPLLVDSSTHSPTPAALPKSAPTPRKQASQQPGGGSLPAPGTPASEVFFDSSSITTESVSRASSPLPVNVGGTSTRVTLKNQQKTERQELEKEGVTDSKLPDVQVPTTIMQEPIIGRKKKTKKAASGTTAPSTPTPSRPVSPGPSCRSKDPPVFEQPFVLDEVVNSHDPKPVKSAPDLVSSEEKEIPTEPEDGRKDLSFPDSIFIPLQASGDLQMSTLEFFQTAGSLNSRPNITVADLVNVVPPAPLTAKELALLDAGLPVRRQGSDGRLASRLLVTSLRQCLRGLSPEQEDRVLELERRISESKPPLKYTHTNRASSTEAMSPLRASSPSRRTVTELLKDLADHLFRPTSGLNSTVTAEAVGNKPMAYADDALAYLNQFILPPLPARGKGGEEPAIPPIGNAIPRTYTTGDPTYSVSGIDVGGNQAAHGTAAISPIAGSSKITATAAEPNYLANISKTALQAIRDVEALSLELPSSLDASTAPVVRQALAGAVNAVAAARGFPSSKFSGTTGFDVAARDIPEQGSAPSQWTFAAPASQIPRSGAQPPPLDAERVAQMAAEARKALEETRNVGMAWGAPAGTSIVGGDAASGAAGGGQNDLWDLSLRLEEAEDAVAASRRKCEGLEKALGKLIKRNRRLVFGASA